MEKDPLTDSEQKLFEALQSLKEKADDQVLKMPICSITKIM
jgi:hypothetical protein